jgi:hypothetical protein
VKLVEGSDLSSYSNPSLLWTAGNEGVNTTLDVDTPGPTWSSGSLNPLAVGTTLTITVKVTPVI